MNNGLDSKCQYVNSSKEMQGATLIGFLFTELYVQESHCYYLL